MTCWMVESGMTPGSFGDRERWASYRDIAARSRYTVGKRRWVGGDRSVMEKRMPLLGHVRYIPVSRGIEKGNLPSHIYQSVVVLRLSISVAYHVLIRH